MKSVFNFDFISMTTSGQPRRHSVFFFELSGLSVNDCYRAVDAHYSKHPISDEVTFIGFMDEERVLAACLKEQKLLTRIRLAATSIASGFPRILLVDYKGDFYELPRTPSNQLPLAQEACVHTLKHAGCSWIFKHHHGMLEASESHHYVKPSLKHTDRFIRTG